MDENKIPERGSLADADYATRLAAVEKLMADGWTLEGAFNHIEGMCDREICCGWDE